MQRENYEKSIRHAHAAIENGPGDAMALAFAGFTIGMVEHDRELADEAFRASVGAQPILRLRDAARAIDWGERAIRLSPLGAMIGLGNFLLGRHEDAVAAARWAVQLNPGFSILHGWLAAPLAKLGQREEAKAASARLLALDPGFTISRWSAAVGLAPDVTDAITDAMRLAGLPE
jgi:tetratricopeptide (TPR) repeat protein